MIRSVPYPTYWPAATRKMWEEWVAGRPEHVQVVAHAYPSWWIYRLKSSGHLVTLHSYDEVDDRVQVKVVVGADLNPFILFERTVFGIELEDLEPIRERTEEEMAS